MIWATTAASRQTAGFDGKTIASKVVTINPANGQVTAAFTDASQPDLRFGQPAAGSRRPFMSPIRRMAKSCGSTVTPARCKP
ncbi:MAG: hypothetical protein WDN06_08515 [Asticcacaulis sp.]